MIVKRKSGLNVVDLQSYQRVRQAGSKAAAISTRLCSHCGAGLMDGEMEDDCSSAWSVVRAPLPRKFRAE